ncbi:SRPBCC family protein [Jatrophihabitans fulvus]
MITVERSATVNRPVPAVFAYLADFTHTEQWDPGTVTTTRLDDGPLRVGARFRNVSRYRGRTTELEYRVERFELDTRLTFVGDNRTVEATDDLTFTGRGDTTHITYRAHFSFKRVYRLAEPFLRRGFEPVADETVAQLVATLEREL